MIHLSSGFIRDLKAADVLAGPESGILQVLGFDLLIEDTDQSFSSLTLDRDIGSMAFFYKPFAIGIDGTGDDRVDQRLASRVVDAADLKIRNHDP